ncbi:hypothetical protein B0T10DRAFT_465011 [Thelonectria olida]|uniref:Uncharacterized protein n=1 Tax=Thelonectria olida TaxID=1576542 RepID=A0A9P9AK90_9HYPO|nr:hypothetical protein B0T10DRAFT_465011 [Thelonectria olida]
MNFFTLHTIKESSYATKYSPPLNPIIVVPSHLGVFSMSACVDQPYNSWSCYYETQKQADYCQLSGESIWDHIHNQTVPLPTYIDPRRVWLPFSSSATSELTASLVSPRGELQDLVPGHSKALFDTHEPRQAILEPRNLSAFDTSTSADITINDIDMQHRAATSSATEIETMAGIFPRPHGMSEGCTQESTSEHAAESESHHCFSRLSPEFMEDCSHQGLLTDDDFKFLEEWIIPLVEDPAPSANDTISNRPSPKAKAIDRQSVQPGDAVHAIWQLREAAVFT